MSSMSRKPLLNLALLSIAAAGVPVAAQAQEARWDEQRRELLTSRPTAWAGVVSNWEALQESGNYSFAQYSGFLLNNPGFPREDRLREFAEARLAVEPVDAPQLIRFFDRFPPLTNAGAASYAIALMVNGDPRADEWARKAWRGGTMSDSAELMLLGRYAGAFTPEDHDARMNALMWASEFEAARRQLTRVSPSAQAVFASRLAHRTDGTPSARDLSDPGYVYDRVRGLRADGRVAEAVRILADRPALAEPVLNRELWVTQLLRVARAADTRDSVRIASKIDDAFPPGTDISQGSYRLRDDYTSLMWLGGTNALWKLYDGAAAAPLFYRYGAAAQTPQTRSKGFYWAGEAAAQAGQQAEAVRYYEMAAKYRGQFYGLLALEALGRDHKDLWSQPVGRVTPTPEQRAEFFSKPLTAAVQEAARGRDWRTARYFFTHIADQAQSPEELALVAEYAKQLGRRDFAVVIGEAAAQKGFDAVQLEGYPVVETHPTGNWTMIHAISRQESEFDTTRTSHAGASGLMQLMPATAREQAGKMGMSYMSASIKGDPAYNIMLGDGYFKRMLEYYGGAYPLAIAAYNAGPGNVNKWLRANGDPRRGNITYQRWIEEIPIYETKNYVQRVIENAVVYEALNPDRAGYGGPKPASWYFRN